MEREFDIIVYGATGFTGKLVAEYLGEAADDGLVPRVGPPEPARGEAAEVGVRADQHDGLAHAVRLHGCHDARRRAAVDDDVVGLDGGRGGRARA